MTVGTLEEMIDDNHAIVSTANGPEYYVGVLSIVNKDLLETGCTVLLHHRVITHTHAYMRTIIIKNWTVQSFNLFISFPQVMTVVGILADDSDPMVTVMKVEKAPLETYADIGGLHDQVCIWYDLTFQ